MFWSKSAFAAVAALLVGKNEGFQNVVEPTERLSGSNTAMVLKNSDTENHDLSSGRRRFLGFVVGTGGWWLLGNAAEAKDELFKPNPLTNGVLEQVCIVFALLCWQ